MKLRLTPAALWLFGTAVFAFEENNFELGTVVVTAARTAQTADEALVPVTVITRQDIERSQAQSVEDLLRGQPGIAIGNNGGLGQVSSVFLRGTNSDHVLVLIDGFKVGSATTGTTAFQDLPVALIERIEIVRGPRSSLYGSEAMGGVIQIFTRQGEGPSKPSFSIGGGSHGTWQGSAALSGGVGTGGWYSLGLASLDTQGFNSCRGSLTAGCFAIEPDQDGYRNLSGRLRTGWHFTNGTEAEVNWLRTDAHDQFDGGYVNESKSVQQILGTSLRFAPWDAWHVTLRAGQNEDDSDNFKDGVFESRFKTRRNTFSWQNEVDVVKNHQLVAGIDWQNDQVSSTTPYSVTSRDNRGVFGQYLAEIGGHSHSAQLSMRRDDNQQFGAKTTGSAAWGYSLNQDLRLTAAYGTAFKAPSFNQLYYPGFGNANLMPELSHSLDFGLSGRVGPAHWSLNLFETRITDLIGSDASFTPINIDSARIRGVEAVASARLAEWNLRGNLGLLDPENQAVGANHGKILPHRARQALSLNADRDFGAWSVGSTLRAEGRRYDDLANSIKLGGYATLDLRAEYRVSKSWCWLARIENLLDKDYETADFYNQPGRSLFVALRYQP